MTETREEQIEKAWLCKCFQSNHRYDEKSFKEGIEWADEHPNLYNDEKYHTVKVSEEFFDKYCKKCGSQRCTAEGEWLEECKHYKEETMEEKKINQMSLANCDLDEVEIVLGDKFELVNREGKYYAVRKKPKYPKTYEECCAILNLPHSELTIDVPLHYSPTLIYLTKLLICRDAYWKIAGEQMGLGEPWKPDWDNEDKRKYVITCQGNHIVKNLHYIKNTILAFPTEEMRDTFYENFKELIEQCKELL